MREYEGGANDHAVAFSLTDRYKGSVLDIDTPHGRDDLFIFNPQDLVDLLTQVREWWPQANVFIWDRFF